MSPAQFQEQIRAFAKGFAQEGKTDTSLASRISNFLDENYNVYLNSSPEDCEQIRTSFYGIRNFEDYLFEYTRRAVAQLQATREEAWLWRGLVATSLENCGIDFRDTLIALAELYVIAEECEIDPKAAFRKVAALSSQDKTRGGPLSVYKMMIDFEGFAILRERRERSTSYWSR